MTGIAPRGGTFLRVTFPLAGVNFINQASRSALALLGPLLAIEFGLSAGDLGLLAAILFMAYGAAQLPVGVALDVYGARRVQMILTAVAAAGFVISATAPDALAFGAGRLITGLGVSAGLMAMMKANAQYYPSAGVAGATGLGVFVGSMGGVAATWPVQAVLPDIGWRGVFWLLSALCLAIIAWITLSLPARAPGGTARRGLLTEALEFRGIFRHPRFVRLVPVAAMLSVMNFTYQGLWVGPWLRDAGGLGDEARAVLLLIYALGLMAGNLGAGAASNWVQRRGFGPMAVPVGATLLLMAAQAWLAMFPPASFTWLAAAWTLFSFSAATGPVAYAAVSQGFPPALAGRVATAINFSMLAGVVVVQNLIGRILDLWPRTPSGGWDPEGYAWALALTILLHAAALFWFAIAPKEPRA
ncbi:MFS transporter [Roseomonas sp. CCTCC AB2023176]|uniref:MFS transporter n=1 Tax=Roseomonas sp. CCTCC AB2023176 TaxID=3342640 RepID=UPI0035D7757A